MIQIQNLTKSFNSITALKGINFTAKDGEVTGLIGPNGAGKTTALRIMSTVMTPDAGSATIDGFDTVKDRHEVQRRIGVLPDTRGLYPRLTAREHIRYFGRLHRMDKSTLESRINDLVEALGMESFIDRKARGFSKGQTRKLTLARALVHKPQNLMLDEPTNGLDIATSRSVHRLINQLREEGRSILFCSHIMQEVGSISDRIVIIANGEVTADGTAEELFEQSGCTDFEEMFLKLSNGKVADQEAPDVA
jgi:sodium transport system ATP-binding protein